MLLLRFLLALNVFLFSASGEYVQTLSCDATPDSGDLHWRSLWAALTSERNGQHNVLDLKVSQEFGQQSCDSRVGNFSATLTVDMLGSHEAYHGTGSSVCRMREHGHDYNGLNEEVLVYTWSQALGSLPAFSTFGIRLQLWSMDDDLELGCLQADITPAISATVSETLLWAPRIIFLFVLLVGILRGVHDRRQRITEDPESSDLSLPGVSDCLLYFQWVFLTGSLSLHYPGFFQPVVSKLSLFSLFTTGPLTHGRVYSSVSDGIYSINGTYGGTMGLEHMHQIVGAPRTMDTWGNMMIAILIISFAVALLLEVIALARKSTNPRPTTTPQNSFSSKLVSRIIAVLRIILSYFTLPLSALSFYQISAVAWLPRFPIVHTVSAALLIVSIMLAFIWMFRQLPTRTFGRLLHDKPNWSRQKHGHNDFNHGARSERLYVALVVILTFIRGAAVGGLQVHGPVQVAVLAASEICLLVINRWLAIYPLISMGNLFPALRLVLTLLMVCFVRGVASASMSRSCGYIILAVHAFMLAFAILLPAVYHLWAISCGSQRRTTNYDSISHQLAHVEANRFDIALTAQTRPSTGRRTPVDRSGSHKSSTLNSRSSPELRKHEYFRQPRHSSIRNINSEKPPSITASTSLSGNIESGSSTQSGSDSPHSSSHSSLSNSDDWHDTRSIPLGPRWNDYTFRESDAFYSSVASQTLTAVSPSATTTTTLRSPLSPAISIWSFAGIRSWWSAETATPQASGFQVVRPARSLHQASVGEDARGGGLDVEDRPR